MNKSHFITLPYDVVLMARLELKLKEYKDRYEIHRAPELQLDTIFKIFILDKLLKEWKLCTWDLSREWTKANPSLWDSDTISNAFGVIKGYTEDCGKNLVGGTGLPQLTD